jgi:hypothetical protein
MKFFLTESNVGATGNHDKYKQGDNPPVFLILWTTYTAVGRAIRLISRHDINHSSISFHPRAQVAHSMNFNANGFVDEHMDQVLPENKVYVYRVTADNSMVSRMRAKMETLRRLKYNVMDALMRMFTNRDLQIKEQSRFCSQMVAEVLRAGGIRVYPNKKTANFMPWDFTHSKLFTLVFQGTAGELSELNTDL